jgi:starch-binding outer membrane protein, SusD/RagB family
MKKTKIYPIVLVLLLFLSSCEGFLDQSPSTALPSSEAISSVKDLGNAVNGAYTRLIDLDANGHSYYAGDFICLGDLRSEDMDYILNSNQISPVGRLDYEKNSDFAESFWLTPYTVLGRINDILSVTDKITVEAGEEDSFNDLMGQLYALRALMHFNLAITYAQLPTALHDGMTMTTENGGIPLSDKKFAVDYKPKRSTLQQTYEFIIADYDRAISMLNPDPVKDDTYGSINIYAAKALKARTLLYMGDYTNALAEAEDVINTAPGAGYRLSYIGDYTAMWGLTSQPEFLFELITNLQYNSQRNSIGYYSTPDGYGEFGCTEAFKDWIQADPNDIRGQLVVYKTSSGGDGGGFYPAKYPGRDGSDYVNNPRVIRMAEVYLIAAEAAFRASDNTKATEYINALRAKRILLYSDVASVTLDDILNERRKELFGEGQRSWDTWRNQRSIVISRFSVDPVNFDNFRTLVAIPQRETDISDVLTQNQGW